MLLTNFDVISNVLYFTANSSKVTIADEGQVVGTVIPNGRSLNAWVLAPILEHCILGMCCSEDFDTEYLLLLHQEERHDPDGSFGLSARNLFLVTSTNEVIGVYLPKFEEYLLQNNMPRNI